MKRRNFVSALFGAIVALPVIGKLVDKKSIAKDLLNTPVKLGISPKRKLTARFESIRWDINQKEKFVTIHLDEKKIHGERGKSYTNLIKGHRIEFEAMGYQVFYSLI